MSSSPAPGRVALVTGGSSGIGAATVVELARQGEPVIFVGRDRHRCERVRSQATAMGPGARVEYRIADLSRTAAVRSLVAGLTDEPIGLLVNNAGAIFARRELTEEGIERTWALNVLAPYILTEGLWGSLARYSPGRVVNVASEAHRYGSPEPSAPPGSGRYSALRTYGGSKAALIQLTRYWAERVDPARVTVYAVHPGFVRSRFAQNNSGLLGAGFRLSAALAGISCRRAASYVCRLALQASVGAPSGSYVRKTRVALPSRAATDPAIRDRLLAWLESQTRRAARDPAVVAPPDHVGATRNVA